MTADYTPTPLTNRNGRPGSLDSRFGARTTTARDLTPGAVESTDCPNALARGAEFTGTIEVADSIRLEGKFKGEVWTQATLHVVPEAQVQAKVQAGYVVIGGSFKGDVRCEQRVDLLSDCRATGTLVTGAMTMEEGAVFDGEIAMTKRPAANAREEQGDRPNV